MSYHELTRKELQTLCKQNGLPANKTNAVMASSLTSFFSDQHTLTQAYAHVFTPSTTTKKSVKPRTLPKPERLELSLASLILGSETGGHDTLLKKCKEPVAQSASIVRDSTILPNTTPLRRRTKKSDATTNLSGGAGGASSRDIAQDSTGNFRLPFEEISVHTSATVVKKSLTPEPQLAPPLNAAVLFTDDQGPPVTTGPLHQEVVASRTGVGIVVKNEVQLSSPSESKPVASASAHDQDCQNMFYPGCTRPVLMSPLLRITANVDTLIRRATGMLEKFEQWKIDNPNKDVVHGPGQTHLSFDKENLYQQSPCKNSKLRSLQGYMSDNATQMDRKGGIFKDIVLNAHA